MNLINTSEGQWSVLSSSGTTLGTGSDVDLIGWWAFNSITNDEIIHYGPNRLDGTLVNKDAGDVLATGQLNNGLFFDSTATHVLIPNDSSFDLA